jgi:uncharacterized protein (DUF1501 family)
MDYKKGRQNEGVSRRDALKVLGAGAAGAAMLGGGLGAQNLASAKPFAKSVIQIWMWGGPTHLDTFDPKPDAGYDFCGPLKSPIATNVTGIRLGEKLVRLAKNADKMAILRSMTHGNNGHETASYLVQTGHAPGGALTYPCVGAVVALKKAYEAGYKGLVPPYIVLTRPQGRFDEAGFLGQKFKPFATGGNPADAVFAVEGVVSKSIPKERQESRKELLSSMDTFGAAMETHPGIEQMNAAKGSAWDLILGSAGKVFDLTQEKTELRDRYGRNTFGQSCLAARRLVEIGVPYITINYAGWDTHKQHFQLMNSMLPQMDNGIATLLEDLKDRGLLDSTIVWWGGEFGRTPRIDWDPPWNGGRSHFGRCFSSMLAGGGFQGGQVIGESNKTGEEPKNRPVYPWDMLGTVYERLGIDPDGTIPGPQGSQLRLLPGPEEKLPSGGRLKELV